jgi:hypothetical protein
LLKLYNEKLVGYCETGMSEFGLYGQDTKQVFVSNLQSQSQDWIYRTKTVLYNRNSYGHRSKEITELDKDFILFLGCSITVGSAVALEETFPYLVSQKLGIDHYNLAVEGSGYDLISFNLSKWFTHIKLKPQAIVIKWPQTVRTFREYQDKVIPIGPWTCKSDIGDRISKQDWRNFNSVINTDYFDHYSKIIRDTIVSMLEYQNTRVIEVDNIDQIDYGRDLKHPGTETHKLFFQNILGKYVP